jgi:hypothetical protein
MQSPAQLIDELESDAQAAKKLASGAKPFSLVALVVGFEDHTEFIFDHAGDKETKLARLNDLISRQGEPVGKIAFVAESGNGTIYAQPTQKYAEESWVCDYLKSLAQRVVHSMAGLDPSTSVRSQKTWIN